MQYNRSAFKSTILSKSKNTAVVGLSLIEFSFIGCNEGRILVCSKPKLSLISLYSVPNILVFLHFLAGTFRCLESVNSNQRSTEESRCFHSSGKTQIIIVCTASKVHLLIQMSNSIRLTLSSLNQITMKCQQFSGKVQTACKICCNNLCIRFSSCKVWRLN